MEVNGLNTEDTYLFYNIPNWKKPIRKLSEEEVKLLLNANEIIHEFLYFNRRMSEIYYNYSDYQNIISKYSDKINEKKDNKIDVDLNKVFC